MAKIERIKVSNYRCFVDFEHCFGLTNFICLIGRGDSGKSTLLDCIYKVLCPRWNLTFHDTDFNGSNLDKPIVIEVNVYDLPEKLLKDDKFGLYLRFLSKSGEVIDDPLDERSEESTVILSIRLTVDKTLEPKWQVFTNRPNQEPKEIRATDRGKLNVFSISDYVDRHFSWSKGNPLHTLIANNGEDENDESTLIDAFREAKEKIDASSFEHFNSLLVKIIERAKNLGIDISGASTTIDFKDISINEGKVSLHSGKVPFRLKGKGSKRLISLAIQKELAQEGGTILIDELEQGLEPDRAQHLAHRLKTDQKTQTIITSHSRDVLVELSSTDVYRLKKGNGSLYSFDESLQGTLRKNPEAFFCESIIVCEGATEIGVCRALNEWRIINEGKNSAYIGVRFADGSGNNVFEYPKAFHHAGYRTSVYCDSDDKSKEDKKENLRNLGIEVFDCETGLSFEGQVFKDLHWAGIKELIEYRELETDSQSVKSSIQSKHPIQLTDNWKELDSIELRQTLGIVSNAKSWFKRIDHSEFVTSVCLKENALLSTSGLAKIFDLLSKWMDADGIK